MRPIRATVVGLSLLVLGTGCNLFGPRPERPDAKAPPVPTGHLDRPTPEQLVRYLNRESSRLQSIQTSDLSISVWSQGNSVGLDSGTLLCQKPRYFKLVGKKFGLQEVIVGSNEDRFWFYVKRDPSDALYHCSHTEYANGSSAELPFPFQPEWVLEALGMGEIDPDARLRVDEDKATYRLIEESTLRGQPIKKVTVFYKGAAHGDQPQVKARMLYDDRDRLICQATVKSVRRTGSVTVPQEIKLQWPAQDTTLVLDLGQGVQVNRQLSMESFQMPRLGSKQVDLARDRPTGRGVVPARFR
ncbi:MAG TPA: hypothetical protein VKD90_08820 [Gemmataceae bacterium]|nr:hypothetical protein [Gemmataceae bacterium]